jgi:pyruvate/2-oxoglutarate dehydrogenase complex dihydrolipoamide dehydrogenase (E3) component
MATAYDDIVIGAGSAGCAVAQGHVTHGAGSGMGARPRAGRLVAEAA